MAVPCRKSLNQISNYVPAKSLESVKREFGLSKIIKLAGNENNMGSSPLAQKAIQSAFGKLSYYPDMRCTLLRDKLSKRLHVSPDNLVFGNGSFELLSLIAQAYLNSGEESIIPVPTFGWYKIVTWAMDAKTVSVPLKNHKIDLNDILDKITSKTRIIWLCNPNNPTGSYFKSDDFKRFIEEVPSNILVVLDEAYYEFVDAEDYPDTVKLIDKYQNIIVLRTFSKVYGLASLRLGYGIASENVVSAIDKIRPPLNINMLAQKAAFASLDDTDFKNAVIENNEKSKKLYYRTLKERELEFIPTQGNFIMLNVRYDSDFVTGEFLKKGIMIRSGNGFGMKGWLRISIGLYEENQLVLKTLDDILHSKEAEKYRL